MPKGIRSHYNYALNEDSWKSMMNDAIKASDIKDVRARYPDGASIPVVKAIYTADGTRYERRLAIVKRNLSFNVSTTEGTYTWVQVAQWERQQINEKSTYL